MSEAREIRCPGRHPDDPQRVCNAWLFNAIPDTIEVREQEAPPPGAAAIRCPRCKTPYVVCSRAA